MRRHGGSTEETTEAVEDATAATADSATTRAKGASIRPLDGVFTTTERPRRIQADAAKGCMQRLSAQVEV